jgi:hypothetical protein
MSVPYLRLLLKGPPFPSPLSTPHGQFIKKMASIYIYILLHAVAVMAIEKLSPAEEQWVMDKGNDIYSLPPLPPLPN